MNSSWNLGTFGNKFNGNEPPSVTIPIYLVKFSNNNNLKNYNPKNLFHINFPIIAKIHEDYM